VSSVQRPHSLLVHCDHNYREADHPCTHYRLQARRTEEGNSDVRYHLAMRSLPTDPRSIGTSGRPTSKLISVNRPSLVLPSICSAPEPLGTLPASRRIPRLRIVQSARMVLFHIQHLGSQKTQATTLLICSFRHCPTVSSAAGRPYPFKWCKRNSSRPSEVSSFTRPG
jgi:hypothetical protein